ncbi:MAG: rhodanese-like domain-containing protein [Promethearchaeota archaeon]
MFIAFLIPFLVFIPVNNVKAATYTNVSVQTAYEITTNHTQYPNLLILDVREQHEYDESHLHNATLIPLGEINTRISELEPYSETEILVYCRSGARSAQASQNLAGNHNFTKIFNMLGGITDWISAGYPVWTPGNGQGSPSNSTPTIDFSLNFFVIALLGAIGLLILSYKRRRV